MITKRTSLFAIAAASLLIASPASATTQTDLKTCRAALAEQGHFDDNRHSLKFSHRKGNTRKRTMFLTLKNKEDSSKQSVACKLHRKDVIDLSVSPQS